MKFGLWISNLELIWRRKSYDKNQINFPGSWTYNGAQVDLRHLDQQAGSNIVNIGVDLKEFYPSVEWDILEIPAGRNEEYYPEFTEPFSGPKEKTNYSKLFRFSSIQTQCILNQNFMNIFRYHI